MRIPNRTLYTVPPGYRTDDDYLDILRRGISEQARVCAPGGRFMLRPPQAVRREVKQIVKAAGFEYVGMAKSDNERAWLIFRKT